MSKEESDELDELFTPDEEPEEKESHDLLI